jgi:hypothetical protein
VIPSIDISQFNTEAHLLQQQGSDVPVMESPVCTPMGSTFSMLHTIMQLSLRSRITSSSNSFQPIRLCSTSTCTQHSTAQHMYSVDTPYHGEHSMGQPCTKHANPSANNPFLEAYHTSTRCMLTHLPGLNGFCCGR